MSKYPKPFHRAPGNYDPRAASKAAALACLDPSRTQQHQRDESDINVIVKRFLSTGFLPEGALKPFYADFSESLSFQEAQDKILAANKAFEAIPAEIRARFSNDPGQFVAFVTDEANADELVRLKLRNPPPRSEPPVTPPQEAAGASGGSAEPTPQAKA